MRGLVLAFSAVALAALTGCAADPRKVAGGAELAYSAERVPAVETSESPQVAMLKPDQPPVAGSGLAGRTIRVSRASDIVLHHKEVVLTFDDGPMPGKTEQVLGILDRYGVKATFLMVGQMARAYPAIARKVAARGHTVGTHTQNHVNLATVSRSRAEAQIDEGRASVAAALKPGGMRPAPFFRFPYLSETAALRHSLAARNVIPIGADIDSKDYFLSGPEVVRARSMARIDARGSGIILFHDIHARTVAMLPGLLADLKARGYKVVHLVPGSSDGEQVVASLAESLSGVTLSGAAAKSGMDGTALAMADRDKQ